ncbi:Fibronectin type III domain protein (plasmid) [Methanohalobium evestigatum Z-7303]|uniref:Fibronectin type III domain protein n=1 Tax=Methanohalobium evestigatum (strain ATCC BAA-1072 / DSM 3721 / NBRC 107634 / OCM 161 / Z-7303) TaxID=644295 RepID=D7EC51_METEZ|nr:fibronectin type III domain-containing protein [Methanohalobium evestigatum]ADI75173.1 Fibronectin type III domain protein [Methanohalobium evestigatum Z-7303]
MKGIKNIAKIATFLMIMIAVTGMAAGTVNDAGHPEDIEIGQGSVSQNITELDFANNETAEINITPLADNSVDLSSISVTSQNTSNDGDLTYDTGTGNITIAPSSNTNVSQLNHVKISGMNTSGAGHSTGLKYTVTQNNEAESSDFGFVDTIAPPQPTGITASPSQGDINLNWNGVSDGGSGLKEYNVYRAETETGSYTEITDSSDTQETDSGLTEGKYYYYKVSAVDYAGNEGPNSTVVSSYSDSTPPSLHSASKIDSQNISVLITDNFNTTEATISKEDFILNAGTIDSITKTESGSNTTIKITLTSEVDTDTIDININESGSIEDSANNVLDDSTVSTAVSVSGMDGVAPTLDNAKSVDKTTINVTVSDSGTGLNISKISKNDFSLSTGSISTIDTNNLNDGDESGNITINLESKVDADTITVSLQNDGINDSAGNSNTSGSATTNNMDGVAPTIKEFKAANTEAQNISITLNVSEELGGETNDINVTITGAENAEMDNNNFSTEDSSAPYVYTATYESSTDGDYTVTLNTAKDSAGNDGADSQSNTVTVDSTGPTFSNKYPTQGTLVNDNQQMITVDISDVTSEVDKGSIYVDLGNNDNPTKYLDRNKTYAGDHINFTESGTLEIDPSKYGNDGLEFDDEIVNVTVRAQDNTDSKNENIKEWSFEVDSTEPSVEHATIESSKSSISMTVVEVTFDEEIVTSSPGDISMNISNGETQKEIPANDNIIGPTGTTTTTSKVIEFNKSNVQINSNDYEIVEFNGISDEAGNNIELNENVEINTFRRGMSADQLNYVSFPIASDKTTPVEDVMDTSSEYTMWKYENGEWKAYNKSNGIEEFNNVEGGLGYVVKTSEDFTISPSVETTYEGGNVAPATANVYEGWNLIGYYEEYDGYSGYEIPSGSTFISPHGELNSPSEVRWVSFTELSDGVGNYNSGFSIQG